MYRFGALLQHRWKEHRGNVPYRPCNSLLEELLRLELPHFEVEPYKKFSDTISQQIHKVLSLWSFYTQKEQG